MVDLNITPKKAGKLANQVYEQILDWIISGMLQEKDKLPSENKLCESFQVSRPIIRQAITKLQEDKLVKTERGKGSFVLHSPLKDLSRFASANDIAKILQSHEARIALEGEAAALAASRRTEAHLNSLKSSLNTMRDDFNKGKLSIQADFEFHMNIAQATDNEIFVHLLQDIHFGLKKTMAVAQNLSRESVKNEIAPKRNIEVIEEHQKILDAIELKDQEAARLAMRYHIARIKQRIINIQNDQ
ncbi:MAG: FadR family transcriptional regulator [Reichenbachiella sp.]